MERLEGQGLVSGLGDGFVWLVLVLYFLGFFVVVAVSARVWSLWWECQHMLVMAFSWTSEGHGENRFLPATLVPLLPAAPSQQPRGL